MPVSYGASRVPYGNNSQDSDEVPEGAYPKAKPIKKAKNPNKASDKRVRKNLMKQRKLGK